MTVVTYQSTDSSAPTLTGQVGSLVALLDACLVNGYGAKAAAGWTKSFSGTNTAIYRQGSGSNQLYFAVNDAAPITAKEARVCGYETASAAPSGTNLGTGTGAFPTTTQFASGLFLRKSTTADATARAWAVVADATCCYLFLDTGDNTNSAYCYMFGDIFANASSDPYATLIIARTVENSGVSGNDFFAQTFTLATAQNGHYMPRSWTGVGTAVQVGKLTNPLAMSVSSGPVGGASAQLAYPNGPDGGLITAPISIVHGSGLRGYLKGLWAPCQNAPLNHKDTYSGTGNQNGKTFMAINCFGPTAAQIMVETSNTWS